MTAWTVTSEGPPRDGQRDHANGSRGRTRTHDGPIPVGPIAVGAAEGGRCRRSDGGGDDDLSGVDRAELTAVIGAGPARADRDPHRAAQRLPAADADNDRRRSGAADSEAAGPAASFRPCWSG